MLIILVLFENLGRRHKPNQIISQANQKKGTNNDDKILTNEFYKLSGQKIIFLSLILLKVTKIQHLLKIYLVKF